MFYPDVISRVILRIYELRRFENVDFLLLKRRNIIQLSHWNTRQKFEYNRTSITQYTTSGLKREDFECDKVRPSKLCRVNGAKHVSALLEDTDSTRDNTEHIEFSFRAIEEGPTNSDQKDTPVQRDPVIQLVCDMRDPSREISYELSILDSKWGR